MEQFVIAIILKWMRAIGDSVFGTGIITTAWFVFDLTLKNRKNRDRINQIFNQKTDTEHLDKKT